MWETVSTSSELILFQERSAKKVVRSGGGRRWSGHVSFLVTLGRLLSWVLAYVVQFTDGKSLTDCKLLVLRGKMR